MASGKKRARSPEVDEATQRVPLPPFPTSPNFSYPTFSQYPSALPSVQAGRPTQAFLDSAFRPSPSTSASTSVGQPLPFYSAPAWSQYPSAASAPAPANRPAQTSSTQAMSGRMPASTSTPNNQPPSILSVPALGPSLWASTSAALVGQPIPSLPAPTIRHYLSAASAPASVNRPAPASSTQPHRRYQPNSITTSRSQPVPILPAPALGPSPSASTSSTQLTDRQEMIITDNPHSWYPRSAKWEKIYPKVGHRDYPFVTPHPTNPKVYTPIKTLPDRVAMDEWSIGETSTAIYQLPHWAMLI